MYLVYPNVKEPLSDSDLKLKKLSNHDDLRNWNGHGLPWHMIIGKDIKVREEFQLEILGEMKRSGFLAANEVLNVTGIDLGKNYSTHKETSTDEVFIGVGSPGDV